MSSTTVINFPYADVKNDSQLQMWVNAVNANQAVINSEITTIMGTTTEVSNDLAPTSVPVATDLSLFPVSDGSITVYLAWNYTQGTWPADGFIVFCENGNGMEPLAVTPSSPCVAVNPYSRGFTFQGLHPSSRYTFAVAAYRKGSLAGSAVIGTIVQPTALPDWTDVSATGNYTAAIAGTAATTVVANAANGQMGFAGTVQYRTAGAPNGTLTPTSTTVGVKTDGSMAVSINWTWTEGSRIADGFLVFWANAGGVPSLTHHHFDVGKSPGTGYGFTLDGLAQNLLVSLGVAAYRRTEAGIEIAAIVNSTNSPDWQDLSVGTPDYVGTVQGMVQHTFTVRAGGQTATDPSTYLERDQTVLAGNKTGHNPRSWTVMRYNPVSHTLVSAETFDLFGFRNAEGLNAAQAIQECTTTDVCIVAGAHEPQGNRSGTVTLWQTTVTNAAVGVGIYQNVAVTPGMEYRLEHWIRWYGGAGGTLEVDVQGPGIDTGIGTSAGSAVRYLYKSETFTIPGGTTAVNVRIFVSAANSSFTAALTDLRLVRTSDGVNILPNGDFSQGMAGWTATGYGGANTYAIGVATDTTGNMLDSLTKVGASRTLLLSNSFRFRSAYCLVGRRGLGEGNGLEAYAGRHDSDVDAAASITFQTQNERIVALSGVGWRPSQTPGPPTNTPTPVSIGVYARDTGVDEIVITWSYAQPAMIDSNLLADGFIVYTNGGDVPVTLANANHAVKGGVGATTYTQPSPHGQYWSFAVAAYRKGPNGDEIGPLMNSATGPDWQGILCTTTVDPDAGVTDNPVLTPGPPTNACTPTASGVYGRDTGMEVIVLYWSYTQPAFSPSTKPADGFWIFRHNGATATPWAQTAEGTYDVAVTHRNFAIENPHTQTWSFGIQPYRKTLNGIELGAATTSASSPDWQGIGGTQQIITSGIQTGQVQTPNLGDDQVTTAKRQNTNVIGPTPINVDPNSYTFFTLNTSSGDNTFQWGIDNQIYRPAWNDPAGIGTRLGMIHVAYTTAGYAVRMWNGFNTVWNTQYSIYYW